MELQFPILSSDAEPVVTPDNPVFSLAGIRVSPFRRLSRAKINPRAASATNRRRYFRVNEKRILAESAGPGSILCQKIMAIPRATVNASRIVRPSLVTSG